MTRFMRALGLIEEDESFNNWNWTWWMWGGWE